MHQPISCFFNLPHSLVQDAECVWLFSALLVPTPVVLSLQEIGDGSPLKAMTEDVHDLHFVQHKGSWLSLLTASGLRVQAQGPSEGGEAGEDGARESKGRKGGDHWSWNSTELVQYLR